MNKEEIEQKAEEYLKDTPPCNYSITKKAYLDGYKQGYEKGTKEKADMLATFINVDLEKENEELKEMFEIVCKERYGYAWIQRKSDIIEKLKRRIENDR